MDRITAPARPFERTDRPDPHPCRGAKRRGPTERIRPYRAERSQCAAPTASAASGPYRRTPVSRPLPQERSECGPPTASEASGPCRGGCPPAQQWRAAVRVTVQFGTAWLPRSRHATGIYVQNKASVKQTKSAARGQRGAKGERGTRGAAGRRGGSGKPGRRGLRGLAGALQKPETLDRLVAHFEDVYLQLTAQAKQISDMQRQLDEITAALKNLR